jgi:hypothetical protein
LFNVSGSAELTPPANCNAAPTLFATVVAAVVPNAVPSVTRTTPAFTANVPDHPALFPLNVTIPLSVFVKVNAPDSAPATVSPGVPVAPDNPATDHV